MRKATRCSTPIPTRSPSEQNGQPGLDLRWLSGGAIHGSPLPIDTLNLDLNAKFWTKAVAQCAMATMVHGLAFVPDGTAWAQDNGACVAASSGAAITSTPKASGLNAGETYLSR